MKKKKIMNDIIELISKVDTEILSNMSFIFDGTEYSFNNEGNMSSRSRTTKDVVGKEVSFLMVYDGGMMWSIMNDEFGYGGLHEEIDNYLENKGLYFEPYYNWCSSLAE
ncbi:MAG: hypothetical protein K9K32_07615 [Halanaerobiales bacterium]|nr:hypothetical protein [Halanaerobiales bacterium]